MVEGLLDIVHQHEHGVEHEDQSDAEEDAALGVDKIAVDEADDGICRLRLRREGVAEPYLDVFVIAETSCNSENYRHDRYECQKCGIRQRRRLSHHTLSRKTVSQTWDESSLHRARLPFLQGGTYRQLANILPDRKISG